MTEDQKKKANSQDSGAPETEQPESDQSEAAAAENPGVATEEAGQDPGNPVDAGDQAAVDPVAVLEAEVANLKDQLLRAVAETENVRSRARREREDSVKYAAIPLIRDLLGVADNLERALSAVSEESIAGNEQLRSLVEGVRMTESELISVLERHNVVKIDPMGAKLDPHQHEAMFEVPDPSKESGTVVQVIQKGYKLHDRLIRPARVGIAKSGVAAPSGGEPSDNGDAAPGSQVDTKA